MMAHRVRGLLRTTPVLLLTATPMQNSLAELWGLVQYVEPTGTLLGDLATFRKVFCEEDDRTFGAWPGTRTPTPSRHGSAENLAPPGPGISGPAFHPTALPAIRIRDERCGTIAVRRRDRIPAASPSLYAFAGRQRRLLLIRLPPAHGFLHCSAGRKPGKRRRPPAPHANGPTVRRHRG